MKLKLQQIVTAIPAMTQLAQEKLPAKAAYRIGKLIRKAMAEKRDFDKARDDAIRKHGAPVAGEKDTVRVLPENMETYNAEIKTLLEEEVELEGCAVITFADLELVSISPAAMVDLEPFIEPPKE